MTYQRKNTVNINILCEVTYICSVTVRVVQ